MGWSTPRPCRIATGKRCRSSTLLLPTAASAFLLIRSPTKSPSLLVDTASLNPHNQPGDTQAVSSEVRTAVTMKILSSLIWRRVVWWNCTDVSKEPATSVIKFFTSVSLYLTARPRNPGGSSTATSLLLQPGSSWWRNGNVRLCLLSFTRIRKRYRIESPQQR
jgi:hypothetical protein